MSLNINYMQKRNKIPRKSCMNYIYVWDVVYKNKINWESNNG